MQERFAAVRETVLQYMLPAGISKNTSSPCSDLDESDGEPSSPKMTDASKLKTDSSLENFIEASLILNLFIMDLSFNHPIKVDIAFVLLKKALLLRGEAMRLLMIIQCVG
jgi:hypothetical protein